VTLHERDLRLYGAASDKASLAWPWVEQQLADAGTYWINARTPGHPHPRPVWGVWSLQQLHLSIGSPTLRLAIREEPAVTIHLDSGTEVVIGEGLVIPSAATTPALIEAYNQKYDWDYQVSQYGDLTRVLPGKVLAWRTAGRAGRDSFQSTGCWIFDDLGVNPGSPATR
jgi:hypothetical protein